MTSGITIREAADRTSELIDGLCGLWRRSVEATHTFLSPAEIDAIAPFVPQALSGVERLFVAESPTCEPLGFMGVEGTRLEMLFLDPASRGRGIGGALLRYGIEHLGVEELTVNEQNPQAVGFYKHMGFAAYKRTDLDEQGNPYPLLYMQLTSPIAGSRPR